MSKMILFNLVTLDGYFEGTNREIDWHVVDEEFNEFAVDQLETVDLLIFGRKTYELMASYWPTLTALTDDPIIAERMNSIQKLVFSKTLDKVTWSNSLLMKEIIPEEIIYLKQESEKEMMIFGSANLASSLTKLNLIDEYRIMINPVVLGKGNPLFQNVAHPLNFKLTDSRVFHSGNVLLYYEPVKTTSAYEKTDTSWF